MAREAVNTCPLVVRVGKFHVVNRAQAARALKEGQEQLELKTKKDAHTARLNWAAYAVGCRFESHYGTFGTSDMQEVFSYSRRIMSTMPRRNALARALRFFMYSRKDHSAMTIARVPKMAPRSTAIDVPGGGHSSHLLVPTLKKCWLVEQTSQSGPSYLII